MVKLRSWAIVDDVPSPASPHDIHGDENACLGDGDGDGVDETDTLMCSSRQMLQWEWQESPWTITISARQIRTYVVGFETVHGRGKARGDTSRSGKNSRFLYESKDLSKMLPSKFEYISVVLLTLGITIALVWALRERNQRSGIQYSRLPRYRDD